MNKKTSFVLLFSVALFSLFSSVVRAESTPGPDKNLQLAQTLINTHFEIWNDTNQKARFAKFPKVYAPNVTVADYGGIAHGYKDVSVLLSRVQTQHPGFKFTPAPVAWNHGLGRVTWSFGPPDAPNTVRGEDIFTIKNGKISSFRVFLDQ